MIKPILTLISVLLVAFVGVVWVRATWDPPGGPLSVSAAQNAELLELTGTMGRLAGENYLQTATAYSQAIYAAAQDKDRPGAVLLVRDDMPAMAMASTRLQHFPVNAPMLFVTEGGTVLPKETKDELERLGPEGVMMDNNVQVYLIGPIAEIVNEQVEALGLHTRRLYAENAVEYAEVLDEFLAVLDSNHADAVLIAHTDALPYAFAGSNWNAHMGQGWAFVTDEGVPVETLRILERRAPGYPYIYVFAPPEIVGQETMAVLAQYGHVQRIPGSTPQEMAVRWAGYKDIGRKVGWWFGKEMRNIGWGYAEPGHNLLLATPNDWRVVVTSGVLSHMGKHAMLILTEEDGSLPEAATGYLEILQPTLTHPRQQLFTFGWVLGTEVSDETMREFSQAIAVADLPDASP